MKKIAVIGSGISGLTCAYLLRDRYDVTLFEANDYLGGHTHTHDIEIDGVRTSVDTGFIVYNDRTYPNFIKLLEQLGCSGLPTQMSFSLRDEQANLEYNGHNLNSLFAQRSNLLRPSFWQMVRDILRFNKLTKQLINKTSDLAENESTQISQSLDDFMVEHRFSEVFKKRYLYPMAAAIWSTGDRAIGEFPIRALMDFFVNHGLVDLKNRPQWYVVKGGSNSYVKAMAPYLKSVRLNSPVLSVKRSELLVTIVTANGQEDFDEVVMACHSDQALALLSEPTDAEQRILSAIRFTNNTATLHTDESRLPKRPLAWASWNYLLPNKQRVDQARLTYNMNILQHIPTQKQVLVTLNDPDIDAKATIASFDYAHPFYDAKMLEAQRCHDEISNQLHTHYCGAYWSYGFHEDGVNSAIKVCQQLGVQW